jgi:HAD superfamily hydrolase (TIGR01509 family)
VDDVTLDCHINLSSLIPQVQGGKSNIRGLITDPWILIYTGNLSGGFIYQTIQGRETGQVVCDTQESYSLSYIRIIQEVKYNLFHHPSILTGMMIMPLNVEIIRAICFDMDGTLSDSDDVMVARFSRLLKPFHFLFPKQQVDRLARRLVMAIEAPANFLMGIPDIFGLDAPLAWLIDLIYRKVGYKPKKTFLLVSGVKEMLAELSRHYPLAIVSARDARTTNAFLEQFGLVPFFKCVATAQTCKHTKPFPDPILWAVHEMGVSPESCLMVGDTTVDMRAGNAAGAQKVGVLCGFGEKHELQKAGVDMILTTTEELVLVLL